jgi:hypothetical protein
MGLLLWPAAIFGFLVCSLIAWALFHLSDGLAALVAGAFSSILSADLGPWAAWVLASLGDIIQGLVVVTWGLVGLAILAVPFWLRRRRRDDGYPDNDGRYATYDHRDRWDDRPRRRSDFANLRHEAEYLVRQFRGKKWKKRKLWDD